MQDSESRPFNIAGPPRGNGQLVLVVDDEPLIRELTKRTLNSFGYRTVTAKDGAEAVGVYADKSNDISLVITDMMMPVMTGEEAVDELKRMDPLVKIVAVSGMDLSSHTRDVVNAFLPKPYSASQLLRLIGRVLSAPLTTVQDAQMAR
jgi:two-component system, cell cycle sensor histidine kinase and response regulator CckA